MCSLPKRLRVVVTDIKGIKCDMPGCDYHDDEARFKDYKLWLNRPCPKCSGNLLTQRDMDYVIKLERSLCFMNWLFLPVGLFLFVIGRGKAIAERYSIETDGTGARGARIRKRD